MRDKRVNLAKRTFHKAIIRNSHLFHYIKYSEIIFSLIALC